MALSHGQPLNGQFYSLFNLPATRYQKAVLIALGEAMKQASPSGRQQKVAAGYVYFGQFVDHDITRLKRGSEPAGDAQLPIDQLIQVRTPAMDLDSIYGLGFADPAIPLNSSTGELLLGHAIADDGRLLAGADLPRASADKRPLIGDDRNDENLIVAQMHLKFIKLHNRFVQHYRQLEPRSTPQHWYDNARQSMVRCYQEAVIYDFMPTLMDARVLHHLLLDKQPGLLNPIAAEEPRIPLEFSAAAYRFGHSMVRFRYTLNSGKAATLQEMFQMTGKGGMLGSPYLPASYLIDWDLFFPPADQTLPRFFNFALAIDPSVDVRLSETQDLHVNLAVLNLLRGNELGLPDGQSLVRHLFKQHEQLAERIGLRELTDLELNPAILRDENGQKLGIMDAVARTFPAHGLTHKTPLWYYLLAEADSVGQGVRMGPLGSLIIAEVLLSLCLQSHPSVLLETERETFTWLTRSGQFLDKAVYRIADLLRQ
ncbi:heme peroxidase family protein [Bowmanella denitrificans]|uniref:Heme peroxidase family protein n=1 Tax=Bowmanella denitrificans TaxID=366582 RepID=A0ABP3HLQ4_9ALTE